MLRETMSVNYNYETLKIFKYYF